MEDNVQIVTLGGREFPVPLLPIGVMKKLWPITYRMAQRHRNALAVGNGSFEANSESIDDMLETIYHGISFRTALTREEFDALTTSLPELIEATMVVSVQAGGKVQQATPGKTVAAIASEQPSSPTGTSS